MAVAAVSDRSEESRGRDVPSFCPAQRLLPLQTKRKAGKHAVSKIRAPSGVGRLMRGEQQHRYGVMEDEKQTSKPCDVAHSRTAHATTPRAQRTTPKEKENSTHLYTALKYILIWLRPVSYHLSTGTPTATTIACKF